MSIALTGASGQLGRLVVEDLLAHGVPPEQLVAVVRDPGKVTDLADRGVTVRQADYGDPTALRAALEGVERLLLISVSGPGASAAHRNVIDAAQAAGVRHIAYTSIINADRNTNPLAGEHAATEELLAASGLPATILRNSWYHELYTRLLSDYLAAGEVVGSTGEGRVSGAARADFASAAAAVLRAEDPQPRVYELGGPSFTLGDLAEAIAPVSGKPIGHRNLSEADHRAELQASGMDPYMVAFTVGNDASIAAGHMQTDSNDLQTLIGRAPRPLNETLRQVL